MLLRMVKTMCEVLDCDVSIKDHDIINDVNESHNEQHSDADIDVTTNTELTDVTVDDSVKSVPMVYEKLPWNNKAELNRFVQECRKIAGAIKDPVKRKEFNIRLNQFEGRKNFKNSKGYLLNKLNEFIQFTETLDVKVAI